MGLYDVGDASMRMERVEFCWNPVRETNDRRLAIGHELDLDRTRSGREGVRLLGKVPVAPGEDDASGWLYLEVFAREEVVGGRLEAEDAARPGVKRCADSIQRTIFSGSVKYRKTSSGPASTLTSRSTTLVSARGLGNVSLPFLLLGLPLEVLEAVLPEPVEKRT